VVDLAFECIDVQPEPYAVGPTLTFHVRVSASESTRIHAIALRCQIRLDPARRRYTDEEADLLGDVFGERSRWGDTLKPMQFAQASTMVPSFSERVDVPLSIPVTYDLEVATGKLLHALDGEPIDLTLMFSGAVFGVGDRGFWVEPVPWHAEAKFRMPTSVWPALMDRYFPNEGWLRLRRETIDELLRFKATHGFATWDDTIRQLMGRAARLAATEDVAIAADLATTTADPADVAR
jgi:hypothetical protein